MKRTRPPGAYIGKESSLQASAIKLARAIAGTSILVAHIPNGRNAGSVRMGGFWKSQGVVSGMPDIMVFGRDPFRQYAGLAIELKVWPGKPSPEQLACHELLIHAGWKVAVCYGLDEVERAVRGYLGDEVSPDHFLQLTKGALT